MGKLLVLCCFFVGGHLLFSESISGVSDYPKFCKMAVEDELVFSEFKRCAKYQEVLEHVSFSQGKDYLDIILQRYPEILNQIGRCRENDLLGNPNTYFYGELYGYFSPTTLRYMKVAGDLISLFGSLADKRIAEIGIGYGGQCKIISDITGFSDYTLIDLPEVCFLSEKYLNLLHVNGVSFVNNGNISENEIYDLVISNYAFSEISVDEQLNYIKNVINKSKNGYMTCNFVSDLFKIKSLSLDEILLLIQLPNRKIELFPEEPITFSNNVIIVWREVED